MNIAEIQEDKGGFERKLYLGVENFHPVALNPTKQELNDMGIPAQEEPQYVTKVKRDFDNSGVEKEYDQVSLRFFLDNKDETNRIRTQVTINVIREHHISKTGKYKVINKYGSDTWVEEKFIGQDLPENMQWFVNDGLKKCYRGEVGLIDFIKALRNLPYVTQKSNEDAKKKGVAVLSEDDFNKMFAGDFSGMRKVTVIDGADQKIGYLLGVRESDGKYKQTQFAKSPLKAYIRATNSTDRLIEEVKDAKANGAYADAIFDLNNTKLQEFNSDIHVEGADGNLGDDMDDLPF